MTKTIIRIGLRYLKKEKPKTYPIPTAEMEVGTEIDGLPFNELSGEQKEQMIKKLIELIEYIKGNVKNL